MSVSSCNSGGMWLSALEVLKTEPECAHLRPNLEKLYEAKAQRADVRNDIADLLEEEEDEHFQNLTPKEKAAHKENMANLELDDRAFQKEVHEFAGEAPYLAAEVGMSVANPLKDAVGPAINVATLTIGMISVVLAPFIADMRGGYGSIGCSLTKECDESKYPLEGFDILVLFMLSLLSFACCVRSAWIGMRDKASE